MHRLSAYVIVHRTQSNQTPNAIQSDGGRNPIGWRTESDWTANANGRGAAVSAAPTKPTEQSIPAISARLCRLPEQELHQQSKQSKNYTNKAYRYHFTNRSLIHAQRGIMRHAATSNL